MTEPTRSGNILDLILTKDENIISEVEVGEEDPGLIRKNHDVKPPIDVTTDR